MLVSSVVDRGFDQQQNINNTFIKTKHKHSIIRFTEDKQIYYKKFHSGH